MWSNEQPPKKFSFLIFNKQFPYETEKPHFLWKVKTSKSGIVLIWGESKYTHSCFNVDFTNINTRDNEINK